MLVIFCPAYDTKRIDKDSTCPSEAATGVKSIESTEKGKEKQKA
jgi:hypothetical protein